MLPFIGGAGPQDRDGSVVQPADRVEVDHAAHSLQAVLSRVVDEVLRAQVSGLLGREGDEDEVALRLGSGEIPRQLEQNRDAAGVVVRARVDVARVALPGIRPAAAEVVVVGADNEGLSLPVVACAADAPDDIDRFVRRPVGSLGDGEPLQVASIVTGRLEPERLEAISDVVGGGAQTVAADAPAL